MYSVVVFTSGPVATNSFLVFDEEGHGLIVDVPPDSFESVVEQIEEKGITPGAVVLTHSHWDHTADLNRFRERYGEKLIVYGHPEDEYRLSDPNSYLGFPIGIRFEPMKSDRPLVGGDTFTLGQMEFSVIHAPGHTEGSICLHDADNRILFAGDVLFAGSIGRTDLHGGDHEQLMDSIHTKLMRLDDDTRVLPGHGPTTTIGEERESNPFVDPARL